MEALIPAGFPAIVRGRNPRGDLSRGNLPLHLEGPGDVEYSPLPRVFHGGAIHDARGRERFPGARFLLSRVAVGCRSVGDGLAEGGAGGDAAQEDDKAADGEAGRHRDARGGARRPARVHAEMMSGMDAEELGALLSRQNQAGETLFVAAEYGKTGLHSVARNGHAEVVRALLEAEPSIALRTTRRARPRYTWPPRARDICPGGGGNKQARELKQQVSDIKNEVHSQLEQTRQTLVRMQGIAKRINKLHEEGLYC